MSTVNDLPPEEKIYRVELNNDSFFFINNEEKEKLLEARGNFIELKTGEVINKSFIVDIKIDKERTGDRFKALPEEKREELRKLVQSKKMTMLSDLIRD